ncbi:DUF6344 domain-containing protein [Streptomyces sp. S1D4-11]
MTQNKVMKLWTAIVTAFVALCTALGFITTTAAAAVPQAEATRNSTVAATVPTITPWAGPYSRALPPTMKQRIRAEAHGSSPSCLSTARRPRPARPTWPTSRRSAPLRPTPSPRPASSADRRGSAPSPSPSPLT